MNKKTQKRRVGSSIKSRRKKLHRNQSTVLEEEEREGMEDEQEMYHDDDSQDDGENNQRKKPRQELLSRSGRGDFEGEEHENAPSFRHQKEMDDDNEKRDTIPVPGYVGSFLDESLEQCITIPVSGNVLSRKEKQWEKKKWDKMFDLLLVYRTRERHCNVPTSHKEDAINLGHWLHNQRQRKKEGQIDANRRKRLEDIGVVWDPISEQWENNYRVLVEFQRREGHCNVPQSHKEDETNLGRWLNHQRQRKKKGELDGSLEKRLEDIGVVWDIDSEQWENNYRLLVKFQQREGHCVVVQSHKEDGMNLGFWVCKQRQQKKRGNLGGSLEKRLEDIGVVWDIRSEQWEDNYRLVVKFRQREGHCYVPNRHKEDGMDIGSWLSNQRKRLKKGKLDRRLEKQLEDVGVVWTASPSL